jgi:hypothetical protein
VYVAILHLIHVQCVELGSAVLAAKPYTLTPAVRSFWHNIQLHVCLLNSMGRCYFCHCRHVCRLTAIEFDAINLRSLKVEFAFDIHSLDLEAF